MIADDRHQKPQRPDQVWRDIQHDPAFAERFAHQGEFEMFQIAKSAMDQF